MVPVRDNYLAWNLQGSNAFQENRLRLCHYQQVRLSGDRVLLTSSSSAITMTCFKSECIPRTSFANHHVASFSRLSNSRTSNLDSDDLTGRCDQGRCVRSPFDSCMCTESHQSDLTKVGWVEAQTSPDVSLTWQKSDWTGSVGKCVQMDAVGDRRRYRDDPDLHYGYHGRSNCHRRDHDSLDTSPVPGGRGVWGGL